MKKKREQLKAVMKACLDNDVNIPDAIKEDYINALCPPNVIIDGGNKVVINGVDLSEKVISMERDYDYLDPIRDFKGVFRPGEVVTTIRIVIENFA